LRPPYTYSGASSIAKKPFSPAVRQLASQARYPNRYRLLYHSSAASLISLWTGAFSVVPSIKQFKPDHHHRHRVILQFTFTH
jgi:hypothetical protein